MCLKSVMVFLDEIDHCAARMRYAVELAFHHHAHIIGVHVVSGAWIANDAYSRVVGASAIREMVERHDVMENAASADMLKNFEALVAREGLSYEFRAIPDADAEQMVRMGSLHTDLVIVGHPPPGGLPHATSPDAMLLATGIPFLIVPQNWPNDQVAKNVLFAWNASREARRALTDALPLLKAAQSVSVVVVDPQDNPSHGEEPGADIAQHLCRHGINARVEQLKSNGLAVADVIRNAAMAANHDLIVLGAYSHSRSRELFFGGVTRSLLKDILVPTLIAH